MISGASYKLINDEGLHIEVEGEKKVLKVDNVIICAGQTSNNSLYHETKKELPHKDCHLIGGAELAMEIDAKRAIDQGVRLAHSIG